MAKSVERRLDALQGGRAEELLFLVKVDGQPGGKPALPTGAGEVPAALIPDAVYICYGVPPGKLPGRAGLDYPLPKVLAIVNADAWEAV